MTKTTNGKKRSSKRKMTATHHAFDLLKHYGAHMRSDVLRLYIGWYNADAVCALRRLSAEIVDMCDTEIHQRAAELPAAGKVPLVRLGANVVAFPRRPT